MLIHKQQCRSADISVRAGTDYEEANDDRGQKTLLGQHNGGGSGREVSGGIQVDDARCDCNESTGKSKSEVRFAR